MSSALYYPHTEVRNENLVRTALLTRDTLEYICPFSSCKLHLRSKAMSDAMHIAFRL
jgi:hypothetical protein